MDVYMDGWINGWMMDRGWVHGCIQGHLDEQIYRIDRHNNVHCTRRPLYVYIIYNRERKREVQTYIQAGRQTDRYTDKLNNVPFTAEGIRFFLYLIYMNKCFVNIYYTRRL